jgi:hypothetical protein
MHSLTSSSRRCSTAEGLRAGGDVGGSGGAGRSAADLSEGRERESDKGGDARPVGAAKRGRSRAANRRRWRAANRGRRNAVLCVGTKGVIWLGNLEVGESNERGKSQAENVNAACKDVSALTRSQRSESQSAGWMDGISPTGP